MKKSCSALVIDSDIDRRNRIKTATSASGVFDRTDLTGDLNDAITFLNTREVDVVFVSGRMELSEQESFVKKARQTTHGEKAAYISVEKRSEIGVAAGIIRGVDGVLWEPFSVALVAETAALADEVRHANQRMKLRSAASMLLEEALQEVDQIGRSTLQGTPDRESLRRLKKAGAEIQKVTAEAGDLIVEVVKEKLKSSPPQRLDRLPYGGVSRRVQRIIDERRARR